MTGTYLWDQPGIPQKGWHCIGAEDLGEDCGYCEMCGNERVRYIHVMKHPEFPDLLRVGCICAEKMSDDYVNPKKREQHLKKLSARKENFMKREWTFHPKKNTYSKKYKGEYITLVQSRYGNWGICFAGHRFWYYCHQKILTFEAAEQIAFEVFEEFHTTEKERILAYNAADACRE